MDKVLVVASSDKACTDICMLLQSYGNFNISIASSGPQARRMVLQEDWDIVLVNHPIKDDDAILFVQIACEHSDASVVLFIKSEQLSTIHKSLTNSTALIVEKPILKQVFNQTLNLALASRRRIANFKLEYAKLQAKLEDMKYINQAKIVLITKKNLTEEQAHHKIEQFAMDNRITKREAAKAIIRLYSY
ncbi:MAG: ANTAR domain-containing protein [Sphaerochaetaceae bacterium]|nr:ANTAR domain-containing protein [Sphaerochaetaceae bacterium]